MAKNNLPPLPWEVFAYILTFVPPSGLPSIILACQALRRLAEPLLYSHISLSNCPIRSIYLLRTLLAREGLCKYVKTFHPADTRYPKRQQRRFLMLSRMIFKDRQDPAQQAAYILHTERVLERLCHVENVSNPTSTSRTTGVLQVGRFSQIKKFRSPSDLGLRELGPFLDVLPGITHLELPFTWFCSPEGQVQPHHAQHLEALLCPTYAAIALVPFRPIKTLFLFWQAGSTNFPGSDNWELMEAMARSAEVITSLGLLFRWKANSQEEIEQIFKAAAEFHPYVEELTIWVNFWKDNVPGLKRALVELAASLVSFCVLRSLDFSGSTGFGVPFFDHRKHHVDMVYTGILQTWTEDCPTLEKVTFPNGAVWIKEPVLRRSALRRQPPGFLQTFLSGPRSPVDLIPKDSLAQEYLLENGPVPYGDASHQVGISNTHSNSEIDPTPSPPPPNPIHYNTNSDKTQRAIIYRWRCLNLPRSNQDPHLFHTRIQRSELGWGEPMFKRDLKKDWPEGLPIGDL